MLRAWWFNLLIGLLVGLAVGYVLAELQPVPPAKALIKGMSAEATRDPADRDRAEASSNGASGTTRLDDHITELEGMLAQRPDDPDLLTALGNANFDGRRWGDARRYYERALEQRPDDPDVATDLAVVYRNLGLPRKGLELLQRTVERHPDHWQAWFNTAVIQKVDLGNSQAAVAALERVQVLGESDPSIPVTDLERRILGSD